MKVKHTAEAPEYSADKESNVLRQRKERRSGYVEFKGDRRQDQRSDDGPQIITGPPESSDDDEQLPLVSPHADVLYCCIQDLSLPLVYRVDHALEYNGDEFPFIRKLMVDARDGVYIGVLGVVPHLAVHVCKDKQCSLTDRGQY